MNYDPVTYVPAEDASAERQAFDELRIEYEKLRKLSARLAEQLERDYRMCDDMDGLTLQAIEDAKKAGML